MLTRPGSTPGSGWIEDLKAYVCPLDPPDTRPVPRRFLGFVCFSHGFFFRRSLADGPASRAACLSISVPTNFLRASAAFRSSLSGAAPVAIVAFGRAVPAA